MVLPPRVRFRFRLRLVKTGDWTGDPVPGPVYVVCCLYRPETPILDSEFPNLSRPKFKAKDKIITGWSLFSEFSEVTPPSVV